MSADTNSSMQMDNVVPPNTSNDVTTNYHKLPPVSEKTQRELQASAECFMKTYGKQQGNGGPPSGNSKNSATPANALTTSHQSNLKNKDVNMKPSETSSESGNRKEDNKRS